jgi:hypothetical protein
MGGPIVYASLWAVESRKPVAPRPFLTKGGGRGFFVVFWYQDEAADLADAHVAQMVERVLGKDEVISSILIMGSKCVRLQNIAKNCV